MYRCSDNNELASQTRNGTIYSYGTMHNLYLGAYRLSQKVRLQTAAFDCSHRWNSWTNLRYSGTRPLAVSVVNAAVVIVNLKAHSDAPKCARNRARIWSFKRFGNQLNGLACFGSPCRHVRARNRPTEAGVRPNDSNRRRQRSNFSAARNVRHFLKPVASRAGNGSMGHVYWVMGRFLCGSVGHGSLPMPLPALVASDC